jgi:hypothetical protein
MWPVVSIDKEQGNNPVLPFFCYIKVSGYQAREEVNSALTLIHHLY